LGLEVLKKVVMTGGAGLLAGTAPLVMRHKWEIELWVRNSMAKFKGLNSFVVDLESYEDIVLQLRKSGADVVIHCAGLTSIEFCETNRYIAYISNVITTKNIAKACALLGIKFVYISTDQLLRDAEGSEEDEISIPKNVYSLTKLDGEFETRKNAGDNSLIFRVNFYTWGSSYRRSLLDFIVDNLRDRKKITLFDDVRFSPLPAKLLLEYMATAIDLNLRGVYNLAGDERLSKYEFGLKVAQCFDLDTGFISKGKITERADLVARPVNLTLSNEKFKKAIGLINFPSVGESLQYLKEQEDYYKLQFANSLSKSSSSDFISYSKQSINDSDFDSVMSCLASPWLTQGPRVTKLEQEIAKYVGASYAVAVCNWTSGLHLAMLAAGVGEDDNVITTPISFVASANCARYVGANVHFVDIDPITLNLDAVKLRQKCEELGKVKAIVPVHFAGAPCDMGEIQKVANEFGSILIEDAAHAIGGSYLTGEKIGNPRYSEMIGFSFHPVKNITTAEGGVIVTNSKEIYLRLIKLRSHGINKDNESYIYKDQAFTNGLKNHWYYEMQELGYNFRLTDLQSALGLSQLNRLDLFQERKLQIVKKYDSAFSNIEGVFLYQSEMRERSGNHLYVIGIDYKFFGTSRFEVFEKFKACKIQVHVHYIPIYRQPYYVEHFDQSISQLKNSERYFENALTLPLCSSMTDAEVTHVVKSFINIFSK
jgi:perosamine synthetase